MAESLRERQEPFDREGEGHGEFADPAGNPGTGEIPDPEGEPGHGEQSPEEAKEKALEEATDEELAAKDRGDALAEAAMDAGHGEFVPPEGSEGIDPTAPPEGVTPSEQPEAPGGGGLTTESIDATKAELYEEAKELEVEGRSTMSKDELAEAVEEAKDEEHAPGRADDPPGPGDEGGDVPMPGDGEEIGSIGDAEEAAEEAVEVPAEDADGGSGDDGEPAEGDLEPGMADDPAGAPADAGDSTEGDAIETTDSGDSAGDADDPNAPTDESPEAAPVPPEGTEAGAGGDVAEGDEA